MSHGQSHFKLVSWTWQWIQCSAVVFPVTGSESSRTLLGCGRTEDSQHEHEPEKSVRTAGGNHVKPESWWNVLTSRYNHARKNWEQMEALPDMSIMVPPECWVSVYIITLYNYKIPCLFHVLFSFFIC